MSIIIVNYNTCQMTLECIDSVFEKTNSIDFEVILVDNASTDGSKEFFEKDNRIKYIYSQKNLGFGRANNLGIQHSIGENIFFLNPDTLLVNNAVFILSNFLKRNKCVGAVGGNLFTPDMKPCHSFKRRFPSIWDDLDIALNGVISKIRYGKNVFFNNTGNALNVAYICGADLMIRKNVLNITGFFDDDFFMYYEDTELCHRIKKCGLKIKSVPEAKIIHFDGGSSSTSCAREEMLLKSKAIYLQKIFSGIYPVLCLNLFRFYNIIGLNIYRILKDTKKVQLLKNRIAVLKDVVYK